MLVADQIQFAPVDQFVRNEKNLREKLDYTELQKQIRNLGGVIDPVLVTPNADGKFVILEGNRRHYALEKLLEYPDYNGKTELPYRIVEASEKLDLDQLEIQLAFGSIDKRLKPLEFWQGIQQMIECLVANKESYEEFADKTDEQIRSAAIPFLAKRLGTSKSWLYQLRSVFTKGTNKLQAMITAGSIGADVAGQLIAEANKLEISIDDLLVCALDLAMQDDKAVVTKKYLTSAVDLFASNNTDEIEEEEPDVASDDQVFETDVESVSKDYGDRSTTMENVQAQLEIVQSNFHKLEDRDLVRLQKTLEKVIQQLS